MNGSAFTQQLLQNPLCKGLTEGEVSEVFEAAEELSLKQSDWLFREGAAGDALFVVLSGSIEIMKQLQDGTQQPLAKLSDGNVVGEMSLLNNNAARSASAQTSTAAKVLKLPSSQFLKLVKAGNVAALKIVHNLAQVMSRRLLLMDEKLIEQLDKGRKKEDVVDFQRILNRWAF
ncbi:MAG: cyclic nucleotide-binding domain-containing protein [Myxococcaceae bacterium]